MYADDGSGTSEAGSGESGAGKTEATKQTLNFLAEVCGSSHTSLSILRR